jgi:iron complex transport system substrate-binding protein
MNNILGGAIVLVGSLLALPALALECGADQRSFVHAAGETCIPVSPKRIITLRPDAIATPLIDLGAPVIGTIYQQAGDGSTWVRGAEDIFGKTYVNSLNLVSVGAAGIPNMEQIATLDPDLIILTDYETDALAQAQSLAPTIVIASNQPFLQHLEMLSDAAGLKGSYETRLAAYREKIERAKALIGDPSSIVVSRFDFAENGLWYYPNWGAVDQVIDDIGFSRPAIQANATGNLTEVSFERIREFDGDILISSRALAWGQTAEALEGQLDKVMPIWRRLEGVESGNHYWYDRDVWVGYTFKSLDVVTDALTLLAADRLGD